MRLALLYILDPKISIKTAKGRELLREYHLLSNEDRDDVVDGQVLKLAAEHHAAARVNEWLLVLLLANLLPESCTARCRSTYQKISRSARQPSIGVEGQMRAISV